jgi:hypothetical protein
MHLLVYHTKETLVPELKDTVLGGRMQPGLTLLAGSVNYAGMGGWP